MPDDPKSEGQSLPEPSPTPEPSAPAPPPAAPKPAAAAPAAAKPAAPPKAPAVMVTAPWQSDLTESLQAAFGEEITEFSTYAGQSFLVAKPGAVIRIIESLRDAYGFDYLVDITAAHWPQKPEPFEIIYIIYSFSRNERIRLKTSIKDGERPQTATTLYPTANWLEREVFDMFGVEFEGHPNMTRILLPEDWSTFPLRKENSILSMDQHWVQQHLGIESGQ
jgi:NADH-quinone oxidoreductase subunit C